MREKFLIELEKSLKASKMKESAQEYMQKTASISAIVGIFVWLFIGLVLGEIIISFFYGIIFAIIVFAALLFLPKFQKKRFAAEIEAEMPFALMSIAAELNMNISLEKSIQNAAKGNSKLAKEFQKIFKENKEKGKPLQECFFDFAERVNSLTIKRCIAQLNNVLEQGKTSERGEPIKRIAREMLAKQKAESKEFSGKLAVFSLLFIAVSAIVPAMFQSFIIVGSMILSLGFTPLQVLLIIAVIFPVIDIAVLLYIRSKTPVFLRD